jgi:hypothetical protein
LLVVGLGVHGFRVTGGRTVVVRALITG